MSSLPSRSYSKHRKLLNNYMLPAKLNEQIVKATIPAVRYNIYFKGHITIVGPNFIRRRGRNTMANRPVGGVLGVAIQHEKNLLNLAHSSLNKDPINQMQFGQNSVLH